MALGGRKQRISELRKVPIWAAHDHRNILDAEGNLPFLKGLTRQQRRALDRSAKRLADQYKSVLSDIKSGGAGFPVDRILRELCVEYTHRYASSGLFNQPISFNYFESFCEIKIHKDSVAPFAVPAAEVDYIFSIIDFFDYVTSEDSKEFSVDSLMDLPEGCALNFTTNGDVNAITFLTAAGREFVISGFSMIRRGNYLGWYIIGGEVFSESEWSEEILNEPVMQPEFATPAKRKFLEESAKRAGNRAGAPVPLEGTTTTQRTIIAGELDIPTNRHLSRCYMTEREHVFDVLCDDPEVFDYMPGFQEKEAFKKRFEERAARTEVMWRLSEALIQLPSYFAFKVHISDTIAISAGKKIAPRSRKRRPGTWGKLQTVSTIEVTSSDTIPIRSYTPSHYPTETGGYWRRLDPTTTGVGPTEKA